jgi:hypothetical protein
MMPGTSLDPSWGMGMIQALVQGAQFGQDLVFTFGPYSFLYTKAYHPALTYLIWSSTLLFTVGYLLLCWQLFANIHRFWLFDLVRKRLTPPEANKGIILALLERS